MTSAYSDGVFYANNVRINPFLASCVAALSPEIAVDFGCGVGTNALFLQQLGWKVWCVDREDIAINSIRKRIPPERVIQTDIRELDITTLPNYSLVICNYVLQHIAAEEAKLFLLKVAEKLPQGGHLILSIFERDGAIDKSSLKNLLEEHQCKLLQEKCWSRWDYDHGPAHFHNGYESFWEKLKG